MNPALLNLDDDQLMQLLEHPELWPEDASAQAELAELLELHLGLSAHGAALAPAAPAFVAAGKPESLDEAGKLDLLEHPELWPADAAAQAELAELLELHLALSAHGEALAPAVTRSAPHWTRTWLPVAAAVLLAVVPTVYSVKRQEYMRAMASNRARIDEAARQRAQDRAWGAFFQQASLLISDFQKRPPICEKGDEDRRIERETAIALLEASHQLAASGSPVSGAEATRTDLHAWLSEVALDDGCMTRERAEELRRYAMDRDLSGEAQRMSLRLQGQQP